MDAWRSLAYASYKERKPLAAAALKTIYRAPTEAAAAEAFSLAPRCPVLVRNVDQRLI